MSEDKGKISRRNFFKGAAMGVTRWAPLWGWVFFHMYRPWRKAYFPKVQRKLADIGVCKSIKVTNISETSWFENAVLMGDIKAAGGTAGQPVQLQLAAFRRRHRARQRQLREGHRQDQASAAEQPGGGLGRH